jgi:enterochelin esterase-like enzyme
MAALVSVLAGRLRNSSAWHLVGLPIAAAVALSGVSARDIAPAKAVGPPHYALVMPAPASAARVVQSSFWSASLGREMPYSIYVPPGYASNTQPLPVLYMLHGLGGSQNDWQRAGLYDVATQLIESGQIPPMLIVAPAGESGYWIDHYNNGPRYASYVTRDLVTYVEARYRTLPDRAFRAIGGNSMGAHGALQLAMNNSSEFATVGAHQLALRTKQQAFPFFGDQQYFERHDPVSLVARSPEAAKRLRIWIDIGRGDAWFGAADRFHRLLQTQGIAHTWQAWAGGHDWVYCSSHLADYLRFYGESFTALRSSPLQDPSN